MYFTKPEDVVPKVFERTRLVKCQERSWNIWSYLTQKNSHDTVLGVHLLHFWQDQEVTLKSQFNQRKKKNFTDTSNGPLNNKINPVVPPTNIISNEYSQNLEINFQKAI